MRDNGSLPVKNISVLAVLVVISLLVIGGAVYYLESSEEKRGELVIYAYDSFVAEWGVGPRVIPVFEDMYDVNVTVITAGDVGGMIQKLKAERNDPVADVVVGIDNSMMHRAVEADLLSTYRPPDIDQVNQSLVFDPEFHLVPYDYGYIAIICNGEMMRERELPVPKNLSDLGRDVYRDQILLLDPSTSSTGASFLIWASKAMGDQREEFFRSLNENARNVYFTWDSMYYGGYQEGEAPIAISYGLETAFEIDYFGTDNSITVVPKDQGYRQIEGAGIVKGAGNRNLAEKFIRFVISEEYQEHVELNVMLPVLDSIEVPPNYVRYGEYADQHAEATQEEIADNFDSWLNEWDDAFA
jgi:thiamine transport system substrate-binding protein